MVLSLVAENITKQKITQLTLMSLSTSNQLEAYNLLTQQRVLCFATLSHTTAHPLTGLMTALQRGLDCLPFRDLPEALSSATPRDTVLGLTVPFHMLKLSETSTRQSRELVSALRRIKEKTRKLSNSQKSTHSRRVSEGAGDRSMNDSS